MEPVEEFCDGFETVTGFSYLGMRSMPVGDGETAVTARARVRWMKFSECSEFLRGRRFPLQIKGEFIKSCDQQCCMEAKCGAGEKLERKGNGDFETN